MTAHNNPIQSGAAWLTAGGGLGTLITYLTYRLKARESKDVSTKTMADVAKSLTETSLALLEPVRAAALAAETKVVTLQAQVREFEAIVTALTESLNTLTVRSQAEREQLQQKLAEVNAERDRIAAELDLCVAELDELRHHGTSAAQGATGEAAPATT